MITSHSVATFLLILQMFIFSTCSSGVQLARNQEAEQTQSTNQNWPNEKSWESIYFKPIRQRLQSADISDLRETTITHGSREIRIWVGFDTTPLRGLIIKQDADESSATFLPPVDTTNTAVCSKIVPLPKERWDALWTKLDSLEIMNLSDSADTAKIDEGSVIMEIRTQDSYHALKYSGIDSKKDKDHEAMLEICETLEKEFNIKFIKYFLPT